MCRRKEDICSAVGGAVAAGTGSESTSILDTSTGGKSGSRHGAVGGTQSHIGGRGGAVGGTRAVEASEELEKLSQSLLSPP